jgi:general L-amino acid transport system substrate-binding protein
MMPSGISSARADVLERVRERGAVRCAAGWGTGFSDMNSAGRPAGFDVDFCRAVAAAVLDKADAVEIERIDTAHRYQALARGEVDIAFGLATWTYSRDVAMRTRFVAPTFFDGQGFMAWSDSPITRLDQARGAKVCVQKETTTAANLRDLSRTRGLDFQVIEATPNNIRDRFIRRECDLFSADRIELMVQRATRAIDPKRWRLLDEVISREPMGPYVAAGDERWFTIVRWVIQVTQIADARAVDAASLTKIDEAADGELRRLAGKEAGFG